MYQEKKHENVGRVRNQGVQLHEYDIQHWNRRVTSAMNADGISNRKQKPKRRHEKKKS
jgi:hypothetical protein